MPVAFIHLLHDNLQGTISILKIKLKGDKHPSDEWWNLEQTPN